MREASDDTLVIFHDENCFRLIGIDTQVYRLSSSQLKNSRIIFNGSASDSKVITLDHLLGKIQNRLVIYLDVKLHDIETAEKIASLIKKHGLESSTIVANSNILFLALMEFKYPEINTVLEGFKPGKEWIYTWIPKKFKPDFLASFAEDSDTGHMQWIRNNGLADRKIVYGVTEKDFRQTIDAGIQKLIMDYDSTLQEEIIKYR